MIRLSSEVSRLEKLSRELKAKYGNSISVGFSLTTFRGNIAVGGYLVVFHGSSIFKIYFDGSGTVTYEYNYFRNPNRVVAVSGNSVDNFGNKLKRELHRRNNKLQ